MKKLITGILAAMLVGLVMILPTPAQAMEEPCADMSPTIQSLQECVQHAATMGVISNKGITNSLLEMLEAAQAAEENNKPGEATKVLQAFINEVEALSGKHIASEQAAHMVMHAQQVIQALEAQAQGA
jgi:hypothetical protein